MRKSIIAMLLAVTMSAELFAGCSAAAVTSAVISVGENESPKGQNAALGAFLSAQEESTPGQEQEELIGQEAPEDPAALALTNDGMLYAGNDGVVRGQVVMADGTRGIENAVLTVRDAENKVVAVQPCRIITREEEVEVPVADNYTSPVFAGGWASSYPDKVSYITQTLTYDTAENTGAKTKALKTGENGEFLFRLPRQGEYTLSVTAKHFLNSEIYTIRWCPAGVSEEDFKNAVWEGIQKGLGEAASKDQMKQWFTFLKEKSDSEWLAIFAEAGVGADKGEELLRKMETERIRLSLILDMTKDKFWRLAEGISLMRPLIQESEYDLDRLFGYSRSTIQMIGNFIHNTDTRREILENYNLWEYLNSEEGKKEELRLLTNTSIDMGMEVATFGIGLMVKPVVQVTSKTILLRGPVLGKAIQLSDEAIEATDDLIRRTELAASGTDDAMRREEELQEIAKKWAQLEEQSTTDAQRVFFARNRLATEAAEQLLREGGKFDVAIIDDVEQLANGKYTGFSSLAPTVEMPYPYPTSKAYQEALEASSKRVQSQAPETMARMEERYFRLKALLEGKVVKLDAEGRVLYAANGQARTQEAAVGSQVWLKEYSALKQAFTQAAKINPGSSSEPVATMLKKYAAQQRDMALFMLEMKYVNARKLVTKTTVKLIKQDTFLDTAAFVEKGNLPSLAAQTEYYVQNAEEIIFGYLTGNSTGANTGKALKRLAGSLAELNSGRNAGSLGMKNKELISMMHSTGTAISNGDRVAVGICVSEMDRLVRESRVLFKQILEGADITQDMSQVAYRNLYNRMEYCIRQSCNTYQQHASVQTLLGQVAALADEYKAAGWLTDEVARAMKNWANAVKAQGIVKYAQVCGQELQKVVNFNMEELLNWKQMQGIEDSLTPKPWTDRLRFDITESDGIYGEELTEITKLTRNVPKNLWVYSGSVQYAERNVFFEYDLPGLQKLGQALQRDIKKIIGVEGDCIFLGNAQSRLSYLQTQTLTTDNWKEIGIEAQELAMRLMWRYENGAVEAQNSIRQMFGISDKKLTDELIEECMVKFKEWKKIGAASLTRVQEKQLRRILEVMQETEDTIEQAREVALQLRAIQVNAAMYRLDGLVSEAKAAAEMAGEQLKKLNLLDSSRMEALSGFMAGGVLAERITAQLWCKDVELTLNETQAGVLDINSLIGMGTEAMKLFRARELAGIDTNFIIPLGWRFISIDGCVTDTEGNPIDGAIVQATNLNLQQDSIEVETVNGAFMIPVEHHFWWGKGIVLSASAEGYKDHSISFQFQSYKRREIVLEKEENEQTVQGGVWNLYGAPVPGAEIIFQNSNTGDVHIITANNNGQYETKLPAGHWRMLTRGGYDLPYYHQQMQVNEDSTWDVDMRNSLIQTELLIRPRYSANGVRANAADVSFKPGDAVQISLWIPGSIKPLTLGVGATEIPIYDNKGNIIGYGQATVTILDDGRLSVSLNDIRSGKYRMQVTHPAYGTGDITYSNLTGKNRENYLYMSSKNPKPSPSPTIKPTVAPSPTLNPTVKPTATPTLEPSPLIKPTATPLLTPSPSVKPMVTPGLTPSPTVKPTVTPAPGSMPSPSVILSETA